MRADDRVRRVVDDEAKHGAVDAHAVRAEPALELRAEAKRAGRRLVDGVRRLAGVMPGEVRRDEREREAKRDDPAAARLGRDRDGRRVRARPVLAEVEPREVAAAVLDDRGEADAVAGRRERQRQARARERDPAQPRRRRRAKQRAELGGRPRREVGAPAVDARERLRGQRDEREVAACVPLTEPESRTTGVAA